MSPWPTDSAGIRKIFAIDEFLIAAARLSRHRVFGVLLLLATYFVLSYVVERLTKLPADSYFAQSLAVEFFQIRGWWMTLILAVAAFVLLRVKRTFARWEDLEHGRWLRIYILLLAVTLSWTLVTTGHNYYFDQSYLTDKLLLFALLPCIYWRPAGALLFIIPAYLLLWQLGEPALGGSILAHKLQVARAMGIFVAAFIIYVVTGQRESDRFVVLSCAFVAAAYWVPAVAKFNISWLSENHLYFMPLNAHAHGWLAFLTQEQIVALSRWLIPLDNVMKFFVLAIEALCVVMLIRRSISIALLCAVVVFHFGVFALYGFLFWTWVILDLALLYLLVKVSYPERRTIFGGQLFVLSAILIVVGSVWAKPPALAWYDSPVTYTYRIEVVDQNGINQAIHPRFFGSYSDVITFSSFSYLAKDHAVLTGPYGVTDDGDLYNALLLAKTASDVVELEQAMASSSFDETRAARLREFLQRYFVNRAKCKNGCERWRGVAAPQQFWSHRGVAAENLSFSAVVVVEYTSFFDGSAIRDIRRQELLRFAMQSAIPM